MEDLNHKTIYPTIRDMERGGCEDFPIDKANTVRSACSNVKLIAGHEYRTVVDREKKIITVYRQA